MQERFEELSTTTTTQDKQEKTKHAKVLPPMLGISTRQDKTTTTNSMGGYNLHAPSSFFRLPTTSTLNPFENAFAKVLKAPTSKAKENQTKLLLVPAAMRHASLGLVAFQREIVERARGRAHARSGGFGLDLRRLFCHDGHFLVDDHAA